MTRVPELRFAGFAGEWEEKSFKNIFKNFQYGLNASSNEFDGVNKYLRITDIDEDTRKFKKDNLTSPDINFDNSDLYILKYGDICFARTGASVGKTYKYQNSDGKVYYAGYLIKADIKDDYSVDFVFQSTLNKKYENYIKIISQRSGQPGVNSQELSNFKIFIPKIDEQEKIGDLFSKINQLIESQQELVGQTIAFKKSMVQKMFPKKDSLVPDFRFKGFENNWKRYSFKDIYGNYESGNRLPKSQLKEGEIPYILAKTNDNGVYMRIDKNTLDYSGNKMKLFKPNSITFSIDNPDAIFIQKEYFYTSNIMRVFHNEDHNEYHTIFFKTQFQKTTQGFGWGNKFSGPVALESKLYVPVKNNSINFEEIELIGKFINKLDEKIAKEERLLDAYKDMKKSLLQKMFV